MIPIAIRIDAGERLCFIEGGRTCPKLEMGNYCVVFGGQYTGLPATRLPQCLAAESDLKRLVEAAQTMVIDVQAYEAWQRPCYALDALAEALKPFKED